MESGGRIAAAERPAAGREHRKYNRGEAADKVAVPAVALRGPEDFG
jgi:hypothetical protein